MKTHNLFTAFRSLMAAFYFGMIISFSSAAEIEKAISVEELRLNSAPAFMLLGVTPSSVEHPTSPRKFATSIASSFGGNASGSTFPRNLAIEVSPYWWFEPSSKLKWDDYQVEHIGKNLMRTLTLSIASTEVETGSAVTPVKATGLGVGFRANIYKGKPSAAAYEAKAKLIQALQNVELPDKPPAGGQLEISDAFKKAQSDFSQAMLNRVGFQLELAGGTAFSFAGNDFQSGKHYASGLWLTPAYRLDASVDNPLGDFTFASIGRYLHHSVGFKDTTTYDVGGKIIWSLRDKPYSVSAEFVKRFSNQVSGDSTRYGVSIQYQITDDLVALVSAGHDFESVVTGDQQTFVFLGMNISLGKAKAKSQ